MNRKDGPYSLYKFNHETKEIQWILDASDELNKFDFAAQEEEI